MNNESVDVRCPICTASLEATRSQRVVPVGGAWRDRGNLIWVVRCANSHQGVGETLEAAFEAIVKQRR